MPQFTTTHFGVIDYREDAVLVFPAGLPAFEQEARFLAIEQPSTAPVVFLQSLTRPDLVFLTLPVQFVDPTYRLDICAEDLEILGLPAGRQPELGAEVLCLAILTIAEGATPTANLMAPVIVNLKTRRALQAIQADSGYPLQFALRLPSQPASREDARCS